MDAAEFFTRRPRNIVPPSPPPTSDPKVLSSDPDLPDIPGVSKPKRGRQPTSTRAKRRSKASTVAKDSPAVSRVELSLSSSQSGSDDDRPPPATAKLKEGGDALRDMAAANGWKDDKGSAERAERARKDASTAAARRAAPPPPNLAPVASKATKAKASTSTSSDSTASTSRSAKPKPRAKPKPAAARVPTSPVVEEGPPPKIVPDFWGAGLAKSAREVKKAKPDGRVGLAALASMSSRRVELDLDPRVHEEAIEIDDDDDGGSDGSGPGRAYESVEDGRKRRKVESLAALKVTRERKVASPAIPQPPPKKDKPPSESTEICGICENLFPSSVLPAHAEACFALLVDRVPSPPPAVAAKKKRPNPPPPPESEGIEIIEPPPPRKKSDTNNNDDEEAEEEERRALLAELNFSPPEPKQRYDARAKGKGRAVIQDDDEEEMEEQEEEHEELEEDFGADEIDWDEVPDLGDEEEWDGDEGAFEVPDDSDGDVEVIEYDDEDDEDDEDDPGVGQQTGPAAAGKTKAANTTRRKGPPVGSSPPKGSMYISTLSRDVRDAYERMYAVRPPRGKNAPTEDQPQRMSAPKKFKRAFGGRRGGGGGGRKGGWKNK